MAARSCAQPAADMIRRRLPNFKPKLGVILGSGMGEVAKLVENPVVIPYSELPGFPVSTVAGHAGNLVLGQLEGVNVACLQGRVHLYEGIDPSKVQVYIYTLRLIGCEVLFLTSAVGSLVEENGPGTLVCLKDHINLQGCNPLIGRNDPIGTRFPSLLNAYDPELRAVLQKCAKEGDLRLPEGVYVAIKGPSFETPAEIQAFKRLGADVVGMSVVPEVIAARHCGLRVLAVSISVNLASGIGDQGHITHEDTLHWANQAGNNAKYLLTSFLKKQHLWDARASTQAIGLIDHTSLGDNDTEAGIQTLVDAAVADAPHTAAVCIYPRFVPFVRTLQKDQPRKYPRTLRVATVVNFPSGKDSLEKVVADAVQTVKDGADEVDMVIDYNLLKAEPKRGREQAEALVKAVRAVCPEGSVALKVIIESGELHTPELIAAACDAAIVGGADFVKTSTGKVKVNATLEAAKVMLGNAAAHNKANPGGRVVGFKAAGGVKTLAQAKEYLELAAECFFGTVEAVAKVDAGRFRFGSSGLLPVLREALQADGTQRGEKRKAGAAAY